MWCQGHGHSIALLLIHTLLLSLPLHLSLSLPLSQAHAKATKKEIWNSNVLSHKLFQVQCDYIVYMWDHIQIWTLQHQGAHLCWRFMKNASINSLFRLNLYYKTRHWNTTVILSASSFYFHNLIEVTKAALKKVKSYGAQASPHVCIDL